MTHPATEPDRSEASANDLEVFFGPDYVAAETAFDTTRKAGLLAANLRDEPIANVSLQDPAPAKRADLERIHDPDYVDAVLTGEPRWLASSSGLDWDQGFATAVLASTGGCIAAAEAAWPHGVAGSLSSGLHHARRDRGEGYCTVNGVALAALTFADLGAERVLVLDLDAHCGGGTADILGRDDRFTQLDVSTNHFDHYQPSGTSTLDVVEDADHYLTAIVIRLDQLLPSMFDALVYNAGMDPHEDCGIGGLGGIDDQMLAERERMVFDWATNAELPVAFVLAGGYSAGAMGADHLTALHRLTVDAAARAQHIRRTRR